MQITITLTPHQLAMASIGAASLGLPLEIALASAALVQKPVKTK